MLVVFILTSIGLLIIGVPLWLTLALIAGILNFIPNFGPLIAMIPAVLVALLQGPATAGYHRDSKVRNYGMKFNSAG